MKRKRRRQRDERVDKLQKTTHQIDSQPTWPLLRQYYPQVSTLRHYLVSKLSKSKKRQRKLLHYGLDPNNAVLGESDASIVKLLDTTVVGQSVQAGSVNLDAIDKDITLFTQQLSESSATISSTQGALKQSEIVDFTIWLIFRRHHGGQRPSHMLAHGFQRYATAANGENLVIVPGVPGIWSSCTNKHVETLKAHPWNVLPRLLGKGAEWILSDMLLQCGLFQQVGDSSNLSQLSGVPLCDLKPLKPVQLAQSHETANLNRTCSDLPSGGPVKKIRGFSDIRFVRHRMLYARACLNGKGHIHFGLGPVHVLNRYSNIDDEQHTVHILKHIFPRQFGLHNVFTSDIDPKETAQPFKDYTLRDQEISRDEYQWRQRTHPSMEIDRNAQQPLPKRLRGYVMKLVSRLRKRHSRCSYASLLEYYCPKPSKAGSNSSIDQASSPAQVSAFCRAVISKVFPADFWGVGKMGLQNEKLILRNIDRFVRLRRYESFTIHDLLQDIKIQAVEWAGTESADNAAKLSKFDFEKRKELIAELLYYILDSFLIPLIRSHFYVTESSVHRNQLFYFRQDVWKSLSAPALTSLKDTMMEQCNPAEVKRHLARRELGVSQVRLLPKEQGMRPIINLRRRVQKLQRGQLVLGKSINSLLTPAFSILNYERTMRPDMLGSAMFSVEDMYPRLQAFRTTLEKRGILGQPLYFAKVDVRACFDTIPQKRLMELARTALGADAYGIAKYSRAKLVGGHNVENPGFGAKPSWRYLTKATAGGKGFDFAGEIGADTNEGRSRTVYVDGVVQTAERRQAILDLLEEHIEYNLIKLGNRFYRQKEGIPQGSIVSSLLCSYFYAELQRKVLGFIDDGQSILLRLIDDFLVISASEDVARRFMRVMHEGVKEFGVEIKAEKSRTNFDIEIGGREIVRLPARADFPYCGNAINTVTLDLSKDQERRRKSNIADSMSVDYSKFPGQTFYRKTLNILKLQMQTMLLSTRYNDLSTVLSNLYHAFTEVAQKSYHYIRSLPTAKQPSGRLVVGAVDDLIKLACVLMKRRKRTSKDVLPYECCVSCGQARWLACTAFSAVFKRRQTRHKVLLSWLEVQLAVPGIRKEGRLLEDVVAKQK